MARNVRNFWIEIKVDGKTAKIATGPPAKDGGFSLRIKQRSNGAIMNVLTVEGFAIDGDLQIRVTKGADVYTSEEFPPHTQDILHGFIVTSKRNQS